MCCSGQEVSTALHLEHLNALFFLHLEFLFLNFAAGPSKPLVPICACTTVFLNEHLLLAFCTSCTVYTYVLLHKCDTQEQQSPIRILLRIEKALTSSNGAYHSTRRVSLHLITPKHVAGMICPEIQEQRLIGQCNAEAADQWHFGGDGAQWRDSPVEQ